MSDSTMLTVARNRQVSERACGAVLEVRGGAVRVDGGGAV
jgi:hypothetical protein